MWIVITDLDGTLLNHGDYSWQGAREALAALESHGIPVVFCTSKTRAEVKELRISTGNRHPFIVENGGAVFLPATPFANALPDAPRRDSFVVLELGTPYRQLVGALAEAAREALCTVRGFGSATVAEVAAWCDFPEAEAELAQAREYDEPFLIDRGDPAALQAAIERRGLRWTRGGRFWHILGANDKGLAVRKLCEAYRKCGVHPTVAALGDSPNDLPMLREAAYPIVIPSSRLQEMKDALPSLRVAPEPGSAGWGKAVLAALPEWLADSGTYPKEQFEF